MDISQIRQVLQEHANPARAKVNASYFKTNQGQYGEGDFFIGISTPHLRRIAKQFSSLSLQEIELLLLSKIHEERSLGLFILVLQFQKATKQKARDIQKDIVSFYLKNTASINNWDLVDSSAHFILGDYLLKNPMKNKILFDFAASKNIWERRIAIISTFAFIRNNKFDDTLKISELLLDDKHDLIHKAVGWMLREVGKKNLSAEEQFLKKHYRNMPRTMLRYAIERFTEQKRQQYLKGKIKGKI